MKLKLISEIQYKESDTFSKRSSSTSPLSVSSVGDYYHKKQKSKSSNTKLKKVR